MLRTDAGQLIGGGDQYLPARLVLGRYHVSDMTLHRWLNKDGMNFPKPIYIGRFRYWRLVDLVDWERSRVASRTTEVA